MKIIGKAILLIYTLFAFTKTDAQQLRIQPEMRGDNIIYQVAKQLIDKRIDSVIIYEHYSAPHMTQFDSLKGIGFKEVWNLSYLFYRQKSKSYMVKLVRFFGADTVPTVSRPLEITADTSLNRLWKIASEITFEEILPYVYSSVSNNITYYNVTVPYNHFSDHYLSLVSPNQSFTKVIQSMSLHEGSGEFVNLNYRSNMANPLCHLLSGLQRIISIRSNDCLFKK